MYAVPIILIISITTFARWMLSLLSAHSHKIAIFGPYLGHIDVKRPLRRLGWLLLAILIFRKPEKAIFSTGFCSML